jgi:hypothetical protein
MCLTTRRLLADRTEGFSETQHPGDSGEATAPKAHHHSFALGSCVKTIDDKAQYLGRQAKLLADLEQKQTVDVAHRTEGDASWRCCFPLLP